MNSLQHALDFPVATQAEIFVVKRLREHNAHIYAVSDQFPLKERIRAAIVDSRLDVVIIGRNATTKKAETYAECFQRIYDEPLVKPQSKRNSA